MRYTRKQKNVNAIMWDGTNLNEIRTFAPKLKYSRIVVEPDNHLFMINEYSHIYGADIGDYIVQDESHTYVIAKEYFEENYYVS